MTLPENCTALSKRNDKAAEQIAGSVEELLV